MKTTKWSELKASRYSPEEIAARKAAAKAEAEAVTLAQLRELAGKTQTEVAELIEQTQSERNRSGPLLIGSSGSSKKAA